MKIEILDMSFFRTKLLKTEYKQGRNTIQLTKNPLPGGVWAVFMDIKTSKGEFIKPGHWVAGFVDAFGNFRYPTKIFLTKGLDRGHGMRPTDPRIDVRDAIRSAVFEIVEQQPRYELSDEEKDSLMAFAEMWIFAGYKDADDHYLNLGASCLWMTLDPRKYPYPFMVDKKLAKYIQGKGILDMLSFKEKWSEKAAMRWLGTEYKVYPKNEASSTYTQLDVLRKAVESSRFIREQVETLRHDRRAPVYDYIAMERATKSVGNKYVDVTYVYQGQEHNGKLPAECFQYSPMFDDISYIAMPPYPTPTKRSAIKHFLPKGERRLKKDFVTRIAFEGETLWTIKKSKLNQEETLGNPGLTNAIQMASA